MVEKPICTSPLLRWYLWSGWRSARVSPAPDGVRRVPAANCAKPGFVTVTLVRLNVRKSACVKHVMSSAVSLQTLMGFASADNWRKPASAGFFLAGNAFICHDEMRLLPFSRPESTTHKASQKSGKPSSTFRPNSGNVHFVSFCYHIFSPGDITSGRVTLWLVAAVKILNIPRFSWLSLPTKRSVMTLFSGPTDIYIAIRSAL